MADRDLRSTDRDPPLDPEGRAHFQRRKCRVGQHAWSHYKGGDYLCQTCGKVKKGDERAFGNQTLFVTRPVGVTLSDPSEVVEVEEEVEEEEEEEEPPPEDDFDQTPF
jgi:hypothetical protein